MAYTKAPVNDTHNVLRIPVQGSSFLVTNEVSDNATPPTMSYIDCFPRTEKQWGTESLKRLHKREGFESVTVSGTVTASNDFSKSVVCAESIDVAYFAYNDTIFYIGNFSATNPSVSILTGSITGTTQSIAGTLAINDSNVNKVCFLTSAGYLHTCSEDASSPVVTDLTGIGITGAGNLVFLNGYLFGVTPDGKIYNSTAGGNITTWNSTDYLTPEMYPDLAEYIDVHKNYLVAFSRNSIEFFYDGGVEVGSPLARQESYASRVGILDTGYPGALTARIGDDIYFIGRAPHDSYGLYRIRDFRVEAIDSQYVQGYLNYQENNTNYQTLLGLQTLIINNNPMICVSGLKGYDMVYHPEEDCWWQIRCDGDTERNLTEVNTDVPGFNFRISGSIFPPVAVTVPNSLIIARDPAGGNTIKLYSPAINTPPSIQADIYTEVVDLGINFYKHIARVDAVGDYGNNTLTLYYNGTPNYGQSYVTCTPSRTPSTAGYGYNASWYNLGAYRRISYRLKMVGTGPAFHQAFDMEYNSGAA